MLKITEQAIEDIANSIVDYIKSQGKLLQKTPKAGGGSSELENNEELWYNYIKRVDPHEKKYIIIINSMLTRQAREVIGNIKKFPNSYKKWMFNKKKWLGEFADVEAKFITKLYKQEGQKAIDIALKLSRKSYYKAEELPISVAFDVYNPRVSDELIAQTTKFSAGVVGTSEEIIRNTIREGLELGESIPKLAKRVTERLGDTYIKNRAEMIARTETIYASNAGAELGYYQSGVVEGKQWFTGVDERTCEPCMDMDGKTALLGSTFDIDSIKEDYGLKFDYTNGEMPHPPLHPRCRCTLLPIVETVEVFKPAKTIGEAEKYGKRFAKSVNYKGLELNTANSINKYYDEMFKKYKLKPIKIITNRDMKNASALAEYRLEQITFATDLNKKYYQEGLMRMYNEGYLAGGKLNNVNEIFQRLTNHEMMHIKFNNRMLDQTLINKVKKIKMAYISALDKAKNSGNMVLYNKIKISDWTKENVNEFIATAFNDYRFSKEPSKFSKETYDIILEAIKNK